MRILCTCIPALGHFHPMLPLARALAAAGHELLFATAPGFHAEVIAEGFAVRAAGLDLEALIAAAEDSHTQGEALRPDHKAARMFTHVAPRAMLDPLLAIAREWQPDVLLHEEGEYAAPLAANLLGLPNVAVGWPSPMRSALQLERLDQSLAEFWVEAGAAPIPNGGVFQTLFLDPCPPALQTPFGLSLAAARPMRPAVPEEAERRPAPAWLHAMPPDPVVHVTFGTEAVYNTAPAVFTAIIDSLADERVNLVITIGENNDPADFGPQRANVRIERFLPHAELLSHCDIVVCHGGCGSTVAALAHGLPLVVIPRGGAVQMRNALACERAGVGRMVAPADVSAPILRQSVLEVLRVPGFRARARELAAEIKRMPPPSEAVRLIEGLADRR